MRKVDFEWNTSRFTQQCVQSTHCCTFHRHASIVAMQFHSIRPITFSIAHKAWESVMTRWHLLSNVQTPTSKEFQQKRHIGITEQSQKDRPQRRVMCSVQQEQDTEIVMASFHDWLPDTWLPPVTAALSVTHTDVAHQIHDCQPPCFRVHSLPTRFTPRPNEKIHSPNGWHDMRPSLQFRQSSSVGINWTRHLIVWLLKYMYMSLMSEKNIQTKNSSSNQLLTLGRSCYYSTRHAIIYYKDRCIADNRIEATEITCASGNISCQEIFRHVLGMEDILCNRQGLF